MKQINRREALKTISAVAAGVLMHSFGKTNPLAEPTQRRTEKTDDAIPPEIKNRMGKCWSIFEEDLSFALREHKTDRSNVLDYIDSNISNMTSIARKAFLVSPEKQPEKIHSMIASIFVSGFLHGIDPNLLAAIAHVESNFSSTNMSPRGAMGLMQITLNSAVSELNPTHQNWKIMEKIFKRKAFLFPGTEFLGAERHVNLFWKRGWQTDKEGTKLIMEHDLFNCMLGARTLIFKYNGGTIRELDWSDANPISVKRMLKNYQGSEIRGSVYARNVYRLYRNVYGKGKERVA